MSPSSLSAWGPMSPRNSTRPSPWSGGPARRWSHCRPRASSPPCSLPAEEGLRTADVYAEADRLGLGRDLGELDSIAAKLRAAAAGGASPLEYSELLVNDLGQVALSMRPQIGASLKTLRDAGAAVALVAGSGPTAFGLFEDIVAADRAAEALPPRHANAIVAAPEVSR